MDTDKKTLRSCARRVRLEIAKITDTLRSADAILALICNHIAPLSGRTVAAYCPRRGEVDALTVLEGLMALGAYGALPIVEKGTKVLRFAPWKPCDTLTPGAFGILEPQNKDAVRPDIILLPLLAFDRKGTRLGEGGGYYDATLAALRSDGHAHPLSIGLAYAQQMCLFSLPRQAHDEPLDWVVTPAGAHRF